MSEIITCPQCQRKVRLPKGLIGQLVRCPSCSATFLARSEGSGPNGAESSSETALPVEPWPEPLPMEEDLPAPLPMEPERAPAPRRTDYPRAREETAEPAGEVGDIEAWSSVRAGLHLHALAQVLLMAGTVLFLILLLISLKPTLAQAEPTEATIKSIRLMNFFGLLMMMGGWILSLIVACQCLTAPRRYGARGLAISGMALSALVIFGATVYSTSLLHSTEGPLNPARHSITIMMIEIARLSVLAGLFAAIGRNLRTSTLASVLSVLIPACLAGVLLVTNLIVILGIKDGIEDRPTAASSAITIYVITILLNALSYLTMLLLLLFPGISLRARVSSELTMRQ